ncbi:MAG: transcription-repair coupling factor [Clostridiales bacterium]|nr:transcription-repair coupling factor [Clostridiales bacterium]
MNQLVSILQQNTDFQTLLTHIDAGRSPVALSGVSPIHRAHIAAALRAETGCPLVLICGDEGEGRKLCADLTAFTGEPARLLAGREFVFHNATASRQWEHRRLALLRAMQKGEAPIVVMTVEGLLQRTMPPAVLEGSVVTLEIGERYDLNRLTDRLVRAGYTRCMTVEGAGQFALRGGILDVFSPGGDSPVRVEFWDDEVDTIAPFDVATQRRTEAVQSCQLLPAAECLPQLAPGGVLGLIEDLERRRLALEQAAKRKKRGDPTDYSAAARTLEEDSHRLADLGLFSPSDRYLHLIYPDFATACDYIPPDAFVLWSESSRCVDAARHYEWRLGEDMTALAEAGVLWLEGCKYAETVEAAARTLGNKCPSVYLDTFLTSLFPREPKVTLSMACRQLPSFGSSLEQAVSDLEHYQKNRTATIVLCQTQGQAKTLSDLLRERGVAAALDFDLSALPQPGQVTLAVGGLSAGVEYPRSANVPGYAVLTEGAALEKSRKQKERQAKRKEVTNRQKLQSYTDLSPGDLVVHQTHGIARYVEMVQLQTDGVTKDYLKLAYAGNDVLYVPATQLDLISKYIGAREGEDGAPQVKLSKMGSGDWQRAKRKAKKATQDMAKELIQLYAQRQRQPGYAFHPDDPWQQEFEDKFEYEETPDQLRCVNEIKADMERPIPMDRLLCGDVGYGKTEVALRAVMKCVLEGKQAAILAPTTVLANQHFQTATRRFEGFPVKIALLSRYQGGKQAKKILEETASGAVDVLIGTHRLIQKDVKFKDLGLLVVDEEQRFGVSHKEKLKELFRQVDVLTLSATPIPRTLNMALSGIRDMSTLEEPPQDRQPVQTYVLEQDWGVLIDAIRKEVGRGGQVYYLHNRVETIDRTTAHIRALLDDDSIAIATAHGQMSQEQLSSVMAQMVEGSVQVLVCTTIIETGIDIPNVNTLIIENADRMGLAQLHQIRGRVGRSARRAYAYLCYQPGKVLSETAAKRLSAVREFAEFGAGFQIAMRDLEIRGAGNLLGSQQSGNLMSVGYDMYLKLLEEAILEERGEQPARVEDVTADLTVSANLPEGYIPSAEQRMDLYRRIAKVRTDQDAEDIYDELIDRYGDPPRAVNNLVSVALLRANANRCGIVDIKQQGTVVNFTLRDFDLKGFARLNSVPKLKGRLLVNPNSSKPNIALRLKAGENSLTWSEEFVKQYAHAMVGQ